MLLIYFQDTLIETYGETIPAAVLDTIDEVLQSPLDDIDTDFKLQKYLRDKCGMIDPEKLPLGTSMAWRTVRGKPKLVEVEEECYHIPFKEALKQLLSNDEVLSYVVRERNFDPENISDCFDGNIFRDHPVLSRFVKLLLPIFYVDDIEVCNMAGSKTRKHKVCMLYWTLGNIPPQFRSSLNAINLLGIIKPTYVKKYGFAPIMNNFLTAIEELESEEGLSLTIHNEVHVFHGSLLYVCADTPAANQLGGFKEGVAHAHRPCRTCMVTHNGIPTGFREEDFVLRNADMHSNHLQQINSPLNTQQGRVFWSRAYGVNSESALCGRGSIDVTKVLVHDFMHIALEGICLVEIKAFINYIIGEENFITLHTLNVIIQNFTYPDSMKKVKPSVIDPQHLQENGKLRQNAAQVLCLMICLPFFVYDHVPHDDNKLHNFSLLVKIINFALAYSFKRDEISVLTTMIYVHHTRFLELYPDINIPPKFHYLVHLGNHLLNFGPIRQQWCMRFEAFHQWFKEIARISKCFKNIPLTLSHRQQAFKCNELNLSDRTFKFLTGKEFDFSSGNPINVDYHTYGADIRAAFEMTPNENIIYRVQKLTKESFNYYHKCILAINLSDNEMPEFGKILEMYWYERKILFTCSKLETVNFVEVLSAYTVKKTNTYCIVLLSQLPTKQMFPEFFIGRSNYVSLTNHTRVEFMG